MAEMNVTVWKEAFTEYDRKEDTASFDLKGTVSVSGADWWAVYIAAERAGVSIQEYMFNAAIEMAKQDCGA